MAKTLVVEISGYDVQRAYAVLLDEELRARAHVCSGAEEPPLTEEEKETLFDISASRGHCVHQDAVRWLDTHKLLDRRAAREMIGKETGGGAR